MIGVVPAILGSVRLHVINGTLVKVELTSEKTAAVSLPPFTDQIEEYLKGERTSFDLPFELPGDLTPFQKRVLEVVSTIPYGMTLSYGEVGKLVDPEKGTRLARAVGQVMKRNPLPIVIPCHRVVGRKDIGGFSSPMEWKRFLLELERGAPHVNER